MPNGPSGEKPPSTNLSDPKKSRRMGPPDRLSPLNYIASLVRSDTYLKGYQAYQEVLKRERLRAKNDNTGRTEGDAASDFLQRWLMLNKPIPPAEARKNPGEYIDHLVSPVVHATDIPRCWCQDGKIARLPGSAEGLFLPVWINLSRTKKEILEHVGRILDQWSFLGTSRPDTENDRARRWEIYDIYNGPGGRDIAKTAEILYPKSFNYRADKREMKAEAKKEYDQKIGKTDKPSRVRNWYDNRCSMGKAAKWRIAERKRLRVFVRETIETCQRMIDFHEQPDLLKVHIIPEDYRKYPGKE